MMISLSFLSACVSTLLSTRFVFGDFTNCPADSPADDCTMMDDCVVCNQGESGTAGNDSSIMDSYVGCSQCSGGNWLLGPNQCEGCQDIFGDECLHCTDMTGCQQCGSGYVRTHDDECGVWYCEEAVVCDENCANCQTNNGDERCAQCNSGYFRSDQSGQSGCLSCDEQYGIECMHCADGQGCQQCVQGYNRIKDDLTNLWYCQCTGDDCVEIMDFEEMGVNSSFGDIPDGYFGISWPQDFSTIYINVAALAAYYPAMVYLATSGEFGDFAIVHNVAVSPFTIGSENGQEFKLESFDVISGSGIATQVYCDAFRDGTYSYSISADGLTSNAVTTVDNSGNSDVIIDYLTCTHNLAAGVYDWIFSDNYYITIVNV